MRGSIQSKMRSDYALENWFYVIYRIRNNDWHQHHISKHGMEIMENDPYNWAMGKSHNRGQ
jgi:hypothetical protein